MEPQYMCIMKFRGPLGFPRWRDIAPLVEQRPLFSQEIQGSEIEDAVVRIAEDNDIPANAISDDDREKLLDELAEEIFPDGDSMWSDEERAQSAVERKREAFKSCIDSTWAQNWTDGLSESSDTEDETELGRLAVTAKGCAGKAESDILG